MCLGWEVKVCTSTITHAGENKTPDIDGSNNGSSLKYNQNCLDIAYKNAYGNASGKPTSSSDFKNYKCYVNGKVVPCTSMAEDDQTKKAEADYQSDLMENATEISGSQFITSSTFDNNEHFGFAQYVNYRRVNNIYGEMNVNGVVAFQCTRGLSKKNVGCEIGVDVSKFKKFIDADWSNIYVEIAGVEYPLISRSFQGTQAYGYWTGMEGNSHPADGIRDDNHNTRICFVDPGLIDVIETAANQKLDFKIKLKQ